MQAELIYIFKKGNIVIWVGLNGNSTDSYRVSQKTAISSGNERFLFLSLKFNFAK